MIRVYLRKRSRKKRRRNGQREHRWELRWEDSTGYHSEATGTADKTKAEFLRQSKADQLNNPAPELVELPRPSWDVCRTGVERAMIADNLRPGYIEDARMQLDLLRRVFPVESPADITPAMAHEWKRKRAETKVDDAE